MSVKGYPLLLVLLGPVLGQNNFQINFEPVVGDGPFKMEIGRPKFLYCAADTTGSNVSQPVTLKWYKGTDEVPGGNFQDRVRAIPQDPKLRLHFKDVEDGDEGTYTCEGTVGTVVVNKSVQVQTYEKSKFTSKTKQFGIFGQDGTLECKVEGKPTPVIQWKFLNGTDIPNNNKYVVQSDNVTIKSLSLSDSLSYLCVIQQTSIGRFQQQKIQYIVAIPPTIQNVMIQPSVAIEGQQVKLTCKAKGTPEPTISFWNGMTEMDASMVSDQVLTIPSLKVADEANYTCVANNVGGEARKTTYLKVEVQPKVTIVKAYKDAVVEGQEVNVSCQAEGDYELSIKWKKASLPYFYGDKELEKAPSFKNVTAGRTLTSTMTFANITYQDAGTYICQGSNKIEEVTATTKIDVEYPPYFDTSFKKTEFVGWEEHVTNLTCQSTANPPAAYRWYRSLPNATTALKSEIRTGGNFALGMPGNWPEHKLSSGYLLVDFTVLDNTTVLEEFYGTYYCEAENLHGRKFNKIILKEAHPPGPPQVSVESTLTTMATLRFKPPEYYTEPPVTRYSYTLFMNGNEVSNKSVDRRTDEEVTRVVLWKLQKNTRYNIKVRAETAVGLGDTTDLPFDTKARSKPLPLRLNLEREGSAHTTYTLSWAEPDDGGDNIVQYNFKYTKAKVKDETQERWQMDGPVGKEMTATVKGSARRRYTLTGLEKDTFYQVRVSAQNSLGTSEEVSIIIKTTNGSTTPHIPLLDPATVSEHDSVSLTCDASRAAPGVTMDYVRQLVVLKADQTTSLPTDFRELISYTSVPEKEDQQFIDSSVKDDSRITVTMDGVVPGNGSRVPQNASAATVSDPEDMFSQNADTMRVVVGFQQAQCKDGGTYKCIARYKKPDQDVGYWDQMDDVLKITAHHVERIEGEMDPERELYLKEEKVKVTCQVHGPSNVAIHWKYQACPRDSAHKNSIHDWHSASNIHSSVDSGVQIGGCTYTRLKSELTNVDLYNGTHNICLIQCIGGTEAQAGGAFVEHLQWNKTLHYEASDEKLQKSWFQNWKFYIVAAVIALMVGVGVSGTMYYRNKDNSAPEKQDKNDQIGNEVHPDSMDPGNEMFYDVADDTMDTEEAYLSDIYGTSV